MQSDICVLDDFFPNLLTGFRVAEYNAYLAEFEHLQVLSNYGHFALHHAQYAAQYPQFAARVREFSPQALSGFGLAYLNFLNNAVMYLPYLTQAQLPFVMTLFLAAALACMSQKVTQSCYKCLPAHGCARLWLLS
jgi:lipopolysaccharide transport system ATP-binding protein